MRALFLRLKRPLAAARWRRLGLPAIAFALLVGAVAGGRTRFFGPPLATVAGERLPVARIALSMKPIGEISPLIYGVNYVWHLVPGDLFTRFSTLLENTLHATLVRYPGGWDAESYNWDENRVSGNPFRPRTPGVDPETFLSLVPKASFVTPSAAAVRDPRRRAAVVRRIVALVRRYGNRVTMWEIGNEWWLQRGARRNPVVREQNLRAYSKLVKAAAPAMKAANPSIEIYATGDWTNPEEFATMRRLVGSAAWSAVGGISIHGYCGPGAIRRRCVNLPTRAGAIRSIAGKNKIYDSEWAVTPRLTPQDYGIRNAGQTMLAFQDLVAAHVTAAAYWPPARAVPAIALLSADCREAYATGLAFGWMARFYRGEALAASGDLPAVAAKSDGEVSVLVVTGRGGPRTVRVELGGTGLHQLVSAQVMISPDPDRRRTARRAYVRLLPVALEGGAGGKDWAEFTADPGTPGRGQSWEIARLTFR